jgi:hypothetical protein
MTNSNTIILSDAERDALRRLWKSDLLQDEISRRMGYSGGVIRREARLMGLPRRNRPLFTAAEDKKIRAIIWPASRDEIQAKIPGRSWGSIHHRCLRLGIRPRLIRRPKPLEYSPAENDVIRKNYGRIPLWAVAEMLPGRSIQSIKARAQHVFGRRKKRGGADREAA